MKSILQLAQLYRDFLDGDSIIPTYTQPLIGLETDTKAQLSIYKKLNDLGFITHDSQDGIEINHREIGVLQIQRAYIKGYMPTIIAEALRNDLAISDILFFTKSNNSVETFCEIEEKNAELLEGVYAIPLTVERYTNGDQRIYSKAPLIVDCDTQHLIKNYLDKANYKKDVFINEFSIVSCIDTVWKRSNYLAHTIADRLEKVIKSLSVTWKKSCTIFASFDDDKLIENIKTLYPDIKIDKENNLSKTELCLILSLEEIRSIVKKDGITGLKQIGENFKKRNKEEVTNYLKENENFLIYDKTAHIRTKLANKFSKENVDDTKDYLQLITEEYIEEKLSNNNDLSIDEKINLVEQFLNKSVERMEESREIRRETLQHAEELSEKLNNTDLEDEFWEIYESIIERVSRREKLNTKEKINLVNELQNRIFKKLNKRND